jgi:hypothetical protein
MKEAGRLPTLGNNGPAGNIMKKYTGTTCFWNILLLVYVRSDNFSWNTGSDKEAGKFIEGVELRVLNQP